MKPPGSAMPPRAGATVRVMTTRAVPWVSYTGWSATATGRGLRYATVWQTGQVRGQPATPSP
ncbi:hypothetical protein RKD20_007339 [Streptomyces sp. SLBN-8D4]